MIDLSTNKRIIIKPGYTDMRLGAHGLSVLIGKVENDCAYVFCGSNRKTIKIIEFNGTSIWLHTKRSIFGKFVWPMQGNNQDIDFDTVKLLINSVDELSKIEHNGVKPVYITN